MRLSIIILNYNVRYYLELCLQSVFKAVNDIDAEIIVVDNASSDASSAMIKERFPQVKFIQNAKNIGFSKGNNLGVKHASGDYICILNPDTVLPEDCFKKVLAFIEEHKNPGAVGIKLIDGSGNFLPESKRNLPVPRVALDKIIGKKENYYVNALGQNETGEVPVLVGAFMVMQKSVFDKLKGFDEDYFMYGEDIDLSYRLQKAGYVNYYLGNVTAIHFKGESTRRNKEYARQFYGAMLIFYKKHFGKNRISETVVENIIKLATLKGRTVANNKTESPESAILFTENECLEKELQQKMSLNLETRPIIDCFEQVFTKKQLIFDCDNLSFIEIIDILQKLKNRQNSYRFRPSGCKFIVGSDSKDRQGEVISY
ncbi:glycosyltransferase family 2 protein [Leeuwenhoekiella sp. A16]|uniref:glycosyltransferase family 2 protein n=1 Tax=Leeuwenhoekiella sp. A16 TaxID=3141462 RepID=UPI003A7FA709